MLIKFSSNTNHSSAQTRTTFLNDIWPSTEGIPFRPFTPNHPHRPRRPSPDIDIGFWTQHLPEQRNNKTQHRFLNGLAITPDHVQRHVAGRHFEGGQ